MKLLLENWRQYLNEEEVKVWTPEEVRTALFPSMPDHVLGDMVREGFAGFLEERAQDIAEVGLEELLSTDEWGKGWYDRYNLDWSPQPVVLDISWEDLGEKERKFLMDKHKGLNKDFPKEDQDARIADMKKRFPGLGKGDHEPVIVKMEGDKIVDIIGGRHRTFTAFLINDFGPIKLNAYVGTDK